MSSPKSRFVLPAVAAAAAAQPGAVGRGVIGMAEGQASRPLASGIAIAGAGFDIYSAFIARGSEVMFPANTAVRVSLGGRGAGTGQG